MRTLLGALALLLPLTAWSHGDWPAKHGGTMNVGGETSFEMVARRDGLNFHVSDHGEDLSTHGSEASLSVKRAGAERLYDGIPKGKNVIFFPKVKVDPRDTVRVRIKFENGSVAVGRFTATTAQPVH